MKISMSRSFSPHKLLIKAIIYFTWRNVTVIAHRRSFDFAGLRKHEMAQAVKWFNPSRVGLREDGDDLIRNTSEIQMDGDSRLDEGQPEPEITTGQNGKLQASCPQDLFANTHQKETFSLCYRSAIFSQ